MAANPPTRKVEDSIPKVNDEVAVGSDPEFQHRWWHFERAVWIAFTIIIILDLLGVFGRGLVANARLRSRDGTVSIRYERIERYNTPSSLVVEFKTGAVREGKVRLWVTDTMLKELGNQRVAPQPYSSELSGRGVEYTFPAAPPPGAVEFLLEPKKPGIFHLALQAGNSEELRATILVWP